MQFYISGFLPEGCLWSRSLSFREKLVCLLLLFLHLYVSLLLHFGVIYWTGSNLFLTPLALVSCILPMLSCHPLEQKALQDLRRRNRRGVESCCLALSHLLPNPVYFRSEEILHDLTSNRKYTSAGGCCFSALATLATLLLAPEWKKGNPLGAGIPSEAMW